MEGQIVDPKKVNAVVQAAFEQPSTSTRAADDVRQVLWSIDLYPYRGDITHDAGHNFHEAFCRQFLKEAIDKLDRLDVIALYRLAELLVKDNRQADFYDKWQELFAQQDAMVEAARASLQ